MGVSGVPVAPHGLILGESEATPPRKLLKHLPDLNTAINIKKIKIKKLPINRPSGCYVTSKRVSAPMSKTRILMHTYRRRGPRKQLPLNEL